MATNLPIFPIEKYQLEDNLGQGAHGFVSLYEKRQQHSHSSASLPEKVAVKMFLSKDMDKFDMEVENMVKIGTNTTNIVKFYGVCALKGGKRGLVMELFDTDLMQYVTPPCALTEAKLILMQVANGLMELKKLKIVHRDVNS